ncbi:MAG: hypothetical protein RR561_03450 [Peptostreptococcus sp.]|uniref:hypothetical protein n=1 Tax=Peptostreptococcus sp. TaxID=1262 RepID=UPI002FC8B357
MPKRIMTFIISLMLLFSSLIPVYAKDKSADDLQFATEMERAHGEKDESADSNTAKNDGKVIIIDINRTSLENFENIKILREKLDKEGYIGLMNIRGDKGYDDRRNYATMGSTGRADIRSDIPMKFSHSSKDNASAYKSATGLEPGEINLENINSMDLYNQTKGEYKSKVGYLGDTLISNDKKIAVLGNSDYYDDEGKALNNRDFCLSVMDSKGRIYGGNIDDINKKNSNFPYGISTDYKKLEKETDKYYKESDLLFVNLGDTFRLDEYKENLNEKTYKKMKFSIYNEVSNYIEYVMNMAGPNDTVYIMSSFPSKLDYANNRRLAPIVRFDMSDKTKGILQSSTTRRDGVLANMDIGVDVLNRFGLKNKEMVGRKLISKPMGNNIEFLLKDYKKIVAVSSIRMEIINIYVTFISISWLIAAIALWQKHRIPTKYRKNTLSVLKELVKFGLIMPLAFLTAPIFNPTSGVQISIVIVAVSLIYYLLARKLFKNDDIMQIGFFSILMILIITIDSAISTPLMQSNIMSYDPMIGARYYGVGNEYEGVTIGSAILGFAVLVERKKIPKWLTAVLLAIILFISAYPGMGANVGGAISECIAYLAFVLLIYDVKIDFKKAIMILVVTALLVIAFAGADIMLGMESHLGNFVEQIRINGPMEVVYVFGRKIAMNVQLAQTTIWVNILLVGLVILAITIFRPNKSFSLIKEEHGTIYNGFLATIVGCLVTLLVNDSGIIAAATDSIYLLIPILIILINKGVKDKIC